MVTIGLIDYGAGNLRSVAKAFEHVGARVKLMSDPMDLRQADKLVLPGVGAFGDGMSALHQRGLVEPLRQAVAAGQPLLGICLGMQLLLSEGEEMGQHAGLGLLPGRVVKFPEKGLKVPHTGWNQLWPTASSPLFAGIAPGSYAYFNHSYYCQPETEVVAATTDYGSQFASALWQQRVYGLQFHPEKSQQIGLQMIRNFVERVEA